METNIKKTLDDYAKKRIKDHIGRFSALYEQIKNDNINEDFLKALHFHNNSVFNSSNLTPASTFSKSPIGMEGGLAKEKKNLGQGYIVSNTNNNYLKSNLSSGAENLSHEEICWILNIYMYICLLQTSYLLV